MLTQIISGGQTGADQAGLDTAIRLGIPHGGWIPKGRRTEAGPLPECYHLREMDTTGYPRRTEQNILDADATLIVSHGRLTGGSKLTAALARKHGRPSLHLNLKSISRAAAGRRLAVWLAENNVRILNVAGPRASEDPRIYAAVVQLLESVLDTGKKATESGTDR
ncbi:MAG: putative molybdenum carrier protein [Thermodesulfobacteriota bacterium]